MKTSTITTIIYTAEDGTTFTDKKLCEDYEAALEHENSFKTLKAIVDGIKCIEDGEAPFGNSYVDSERYEYRWYKPKNIDEISALNKFFNLSPDNEIPKNNVGEWFCIEIEDGYDNYTGNEDVYYEDDFDSSFAHLVEFYERLGYKVSITEED